MESNNLQITDPKVSRLKFEKEIQDFRALEGEWRKKGIYCLKAEFPVVELFFTANRLEPPKSSFVVRIDFTNYNTMPPSIVFIDKKDGTAIKQRNLGISFIKVNQTWTGNQCKLDFQSILVGNPDDIPFICIPGVREYHLHPAHSGNSWFLHKIRGEGTLGFLIDQLYSHSIENMNTATIHLNFNLNNELPND